MPAKLHADLVETPSRGPQLRMVSERERERDRKRRQRTKPNQNKTKKAFFAKSDAQSGEGEFRTKHADHICPWHLFFSRSVSERGRNRRRCKQQNTHPSKKKEARASLTRAQGSTHSPTLASPLHCTTADCTAHTPSHSLPAIASSQSHVVSEISPSTGGANGGNPTALPLSLPLPSLRAEFSSLACSHSRIVLGEGGLRYLRLRGSDRQTTMKALVVTVLLLLSSTLAASREEPLSHFHTLSLSLFLTFLPFVLVPHALLLWNFLLASAAICFGYFVRAQAQTTGVSLVFVILPNRHCKLFYRFLCALTSGLRGSV